LKQDDEPELQSRPRVEILRSATDYDAPPSWEEEVADLKQEMENDAFCILTGIGPSDAQLAYCGSALFSPATQ
jgi:hypothetical protein